MTEIGIAANMQQARDIQRLKQTVNDIGAKWMCLLHGNEGDHFRRETTAKNIIQRENNNDGANRYTPGEDGYRSPEVYMDWISPRFSDDTYVLIANECVLSAQALKSEQAFKRQMELYVKHMTRCMEIGIQRGQRLALGAIPTSTMRAQDWILIKPVLDMAAKHRDMFVVTITGYSLGGIMTAGVDGSAPPVDRLPDGTAIRPDQWYKINPLDWPKRINPDPPRWSGFRWLDMITAYLKPEETRSQAIARGVLDELPFIIELESGVDKGDGNVSPWLDSLPRRKLTEKEAKESHALRDTGRGWRTMREAWQKWITGFPEPFSRLDWVDFFGLQMAWYRDMTAQFRRKDGSAVLLSTMPFHWNENHEWVGFDTSTDEGAQFWKFIANDLARPTSLAVWRTAPPPVYVPVPDNKGDGEPLTIETSSYRNLRAAASLDAPIVGKVANGEQVTLYRATAENDALNNWFWIERQSTPTGEASAGWLALVAAPPPPPPVDPPPAPIPAPTFTREQLAALAQHHQRIAEILSAVAAA